MSVDSFVHSSRLTYPWTPIPVLSHSRPPWINPLRLLLSSLNDAGPLLAILWLTCSLNPPLPLAQWATILHRLLLHLPPLLLLPLTPAKLLLLLLPPMPIAAVFRLLPPLRLLLPPLVSCRLLNNRLSNTMLRHLLLPPHLAHGGPALEACLASTPAR